MSLPNLRLPRHQWRCGPYLLTTDPERIDVGRVLKLLDGSYWAGDRPHARTRTAIDSSLCFSLLHRPRGVDELVGFARVITDLGTVAYLSDFILEREHRGAGIGSWVMERMLGCPELAGLSFILATRDAQPFYERYGFGDHPYSLMYRPGAGAGQREPEQDPPP